MNDVMFELNDGGLLFNKNYSIKTDSIEVIIKYLLERGVNNDPRKSPFYAERPKYNREEPQKI